MRKFICPQCEEIVGDEQGLCEQCARSVFHVKCEKCEEWLDVREHRECPQCRIPLVRMYAILDFSADPAGLTDLIENKYRIVKIEPFGALAVDEKPNLSPQFVAPRGVRDKAYKEMGRLRDQVHHGDSSFVVVDAPCNGRGEPYRQFSAIWGTVGNFEKIKLLKSFFALAQKLMHLQVASTIEKGEITVKGVELFPFPLVADEEPLPEGEMLARLKRFLEGSISTDDFIVRKIYREGYPEAASFEEIGELLDEAKENLDTRFVIESFGISDLGPVRDNNEDDFFAVEFGYAHPDHMKVSGRSVKQRGLYILCDGMGGHQKGEVASALAVRELKRRIMPLMLEEVPQANFEDQLKTLIKEANDVLLEVNILEGIPAHEGRMGTTLVAIVAFENEVFVAHVGDSRCYRLNNGELKQLTEDHNLAMQALHSGTFKTREEAEKMRGAKVLTQAIGPREGIHLVPDARRELVRGDCYFLICSDGLTDVVGDEEIKAVIESGNSNLRRICRRLISRAYDNHTRDNITVVIVKFTKRI
ncbi:MAG: protein phosphatase 2C domain-containing protein [Candidatus Eremiobacteraeota bacterium]|nr:protein phosphatase 2C domain-containing protein [Candidatus Eremiobacteraeota bacterium]